MIWQSLPSTGNVQVNYCPWHMQAWVLVYLLIHRSKGHTADLLPSATSKYLYNV